MAANMLLPTWDVAPRVALLRLALLLPARKARTRLIQLVFHFIPQRGLGQRPLDTVVHLVARQLFMHAHTEGDVFVDRHRERGRLLENHADLGPQFDGIDTSVEDVLPTNDQFPFGMLAGVKVVHAVDRA